MKRLSKLFDNAQISLELLQRFGFFLENGRRLVISQRQPSHLCSAIKCLSNSDNSNSTLQQIVLDTLQVIQNTILSELMDEIPHDIMDSIANGIYNCTQQNDFETLLQLLYKTVIKYRRKNIKMYDPSTFNLPIPIRNLQPDLLDTDEIALVWQKFENDVNYNKWKDKATIATWLYNIQFPQAICDDILGLIDHLDLNLTVIDDIRLFIQLVHNRWQCISIKRSMYNSLTGRDKLIIPYLKKIKLKHRYMFMHNYRCRLARLIIHNTIDFFMDFQKLQAQVKIFVQKWINYHDERYLSKICKVTMDVSNWREWKCYQCNMINDKHAFECKVCHKGINALYLAKCNKSQTFCVDKPFGLINHDFSQQVCIMCACGVLFYVLIFKLSKY